MRRALVTRFPYEIENEELIIYAFITAREVRETWKRRRET